MGASIELCVNGRTIDMVGARSVNVWLNKSGRTRCTNKKSPLELCGACTEHFYLPAHHTHSATAPDNIRLNATFPAFSIFFFGIEWRRHNRC